MGEGKLRGAGAGARPRRPAMNGKKLVDVFLEHDGETDARIRDAASRRGLTRQEFGRRVLASFIGRGGEGTRRARTLARQVAAERCLLEQLVGDTFGGEQLLRILAEAEQWAKRRAELLVEEAYAASGAGLGQDT